MDKIIFFGKNYADHMLELGDQPVNKPVIFLKPPSVLRQARNWNQQVKAEFISGLNYEAELVIKICKGGYKLTIAQARETMSHYTIGLDMTLRECQTQLKKNGHPWTISKVFPDACIIGPWLEFNDQFYDINFEFYLNTELKQNSSAKNMLFSPIELIAYASQFFPLCLGDIILTGTPKGVGEVMYNSLEVLKIDKHQFEIKWT